MSLPSDIFKLVFEKYIHSKLNSPSILTLPKVGNNEGQMT